MVGDGRKLEIMLPPTCPSSIKFNVKLLNNVTSSRGLRQGDPFSPILFLFVADALSALINKSIAKEGLERLQIYRGASVISHILFADDTMLFLERRTSRHPL